MKNILVANLGNRNLKFNGKLYTEKPGLDNEFSLFTEKHSFKSLTQKIWSLWDSGSKPEIDIEINILDSFLRNNQYLFEKVYLIGSNQVEEKKQDQDTYWEAMIIKRIIEENFETSSEVIECQKKVTDNNQLLVFFRDTLKDLKQKHPEDKFIICDAGGTPQQKLALKIAVEFLFDKEEFDVLYKPIDKDELDKVDHYEYRKIILSEQIFSLIKNGNYSAAASLLPVTDESSVKDLEWLLKFGEYRLDFLFNDIKAFGKNKFSDLHLPQIIADYKRQTLYCTNDYLNLFGEKVGKKVEYAFKTSELFSILRFYLDIDKLSDFVLALAIFIEQFFNSYISSHTGIDITVANSHNRTKLLCLIKTEHPGIFKNSGINFNADINSITTLSLPVIIAFSKKIAKKDNNQVAIEFINLLSKLNKNFTGAIIAIDELRNDIAHRGEGVKPNEIQNLLNEKMIEKIETLIGIPYYKPFDLLNRNIINFIKENF